MYGRVICIYFFFFRGNNKVEKKNKGDHGGEKIRKGFVSDRIGFCARLRTVSCRYHTGSFRKFNRLTVNGSARSCPQRPLGLFE